MILPIRAFALFVQRAVSVGTPVLAGVAVARLLGTEDFGHFALILAVVTGGQVVSEFGLDKFLPREFVERGASRDSFRQWLGFKLAFAIPLYVSVVAVSFLGAAPRGSALGPTIYALNLLLYAFASNYRSLYIALGTITVIPVAGLIGGVGGLLVSILLLLTPVKSLEAVTAALTAGNAVELAILAAARGDWNWLQPRAPEMRAQARVARRFAIQAILSALYSRLPILVLGSFGGAISVATYSMAGNIYGAMALVPGSFAAALYPELAHSAGRRDYQQFARALRTYLGSAVVFAVPMVSVLFLLAREILAAIYGAADPTSVAILRVLLIAFVLVSLNSILAVSLFALHDEALVARLSFLTAGSAGVANLVLVPHAHEMGAAWSVLAIEFLTATVFFPRLVRRTASMQRKADRALGQDVHFEANEP